MNDLIDLLGFMLVLVIVAVLAAGVIWFTAHNEAKSYNKFCDTPVETWDAIWLDLRIDECN